MEVTGKNHLHLEK